MKMCGEKPETKLYKSMRRIPPAMFTCKIMSCNIDFIHNIGKKKDSIL